MTDSTAAAIPAPALARVYAAVDYVAELDGQDRTLALEMSQAMLNDLIERGELYPLVNYIRRYCDVLDSPEDAERIAADI